MPDVTTSSQPVPRWFRVVAIVAILWNLLGCMAYLSDVTLKPEDVARMTPAQQEMYASRPKWAVAGTALAVWGGALGSLGLFLRKRWATPVLLVSLIGVIVQDIALFGLSNAVSATGPVVYVLQGLVLVVAVWLLMLARRADTQGWLT